jgi:uncharacterized protein YbcI
MLVPFNPMNQCLARRVARAAGTFEHLLTGRSPTSVTVVANGDALVVTLHESFSPLERDIMAHGERGRERVESYHRRLFEHSCEAFRKHLRTSTGVSLESAISHVDGATGSVLKTFTTAKSVEVFLLGNGLPVLGVPIDSHLHANGVHVQGAGGTGAASK